MNCDERPLLQFLRAELDAAETERMVKHVENCLDCRERLQVMAMLEARSSQNRQFFSSGRKYWLLAATLLMAVSIPIFYRTWFETAPERLSLAALATQEKYTLVPLQTRSEAPSREEKAQIEAFAAYLRDDFRKAESWFKQASPGPETAFYRGVSLYFLDRYPEALKSLRQAARENSRWAAPSRWYQAQVHLKQGLAGPARDLLRELAQDPEFAGPAGQLLERLPR